jgi:hypothetical protein
MVISIQPAYCPQLVTELVHAAHRLLACLQGDLLWSYAGLDLRAQTVIAEAVGVEPAMLLQDLRMISIAANFL